MKCCLNHQERVHLIAVSIYGITGLEEGISQRDWPEDMPLHDTDVTIVSRLMSKLVCVCPGSTGMWWFNVRRSACQKCFDRTIHKDDKCVRNDKIVRASMWKPQNLPWHNCGDCSLNHVRTCEHLHACAVDIDQFSWKCNFDQDDFKTRDCGSCQCAHTCA